MENILKHISYKLSKYNTLHSTFNFINLSQISSKKALTLLKKKHILFNKKKIFLNEISSPLIKTQTGILDENGLFSEKIFGPLQNNTCKCKQFFDVLFLNKRCLYCFVEINTINIRKYKLAYIELYFGVLLEQYSYILNFFFKKKKIIFNNNFMQYNSPVTTLENIKTYFLNYNIFYKLRKKYKYKEKNIPNIIYLDSDLLFDIYKSVTLNKCLEYYKKAQIFSNVIKLLIKKIDFFFELKSVYKILDNVISNNITFHKDNIKLNKILEIYINRLRILESFITTHFLLEDIYLKCLPVLGAGFREINKFGVKNLNYTYLVILILNYISKRQYQIVYLMFYIENAKKKALIPYITNKNNKNKNKNKKSLINKIETFFDKTPKNWVNFCNYFVLKLRLLLKIYIIFIKMRKNIFNHFKHSFFKRFIKSNKLILELKKSVIKKLKNTLKDFKILIQIFLRNKIFKPTYSKDIEYNEKVDMYQFQKLVHTYTCLAEIVNFYFFSKTLKNDWRNITINYQNQFNIIIRNPESIVEQIIGKSSVIRQNLTGKRVDYSARNCIVPGPLLKLNECGIPLDILMILYESNIVQFLLNKIFNIEKITKKKFLTNFFNQKNLLKNYIFFFKKDIQNALNVVKNIVIMQKPFIYTCLKKILKDKVLLLNRAPTLHKYSIQGFYSFINFSHIMSFHPNMCESFNADFDGDLIAIHLPLTSISQLECKKYLLTSSNFFSTKTSKFLLQPVREMLLGHFYLTYQPKKRNLKILNYFLTSEQAIQCFLNKKLLLHTIILIKKNFKNMNFLIKFFNKKNNNFLKKKIIIYKILKSKIFLNKIYIFTNLGLFITQNEFYPYYKISNFFYKTTIGKLLFFKNLQKILLTVRSLKNLI